MALPLPSRSGTCVVTGASSGIGAELARQLARRGHGLTLVARRKTALEKLAQELSRDRLLRVEVLTADLTDPDARAGLVDAVADLELRVEGLVNNAGVSTSGLVYRADRERELSMIRTDVEAVVDLCTLFLPAMVERRSGAVLNVASTAAFQPLPGQAGYGASKAFILSYSHALRRELRGTGVTVTALCPGPVKTPFIEAAGFTEAEATGALPGFMWLSPEEVARAGVHGLERGRSVVVPGAGNRAVAYIAHMMPRDLIVSIVAHEHPAFRR
jgi:adhesin HecA-like repeat protein